MSDNHFFMEQELCNGVMNDKVVDRAHKKREPKHWQARHSRTESVVVQKRGIIARVDVQHSQDLTEPLIAGGHDLLDGLSPEERRALLDEAPARPAPPPAAASEPPTGALCFSSKASTNGGARPGKRRQSSTEAADKEKKKHTGPLSFADDDE